MSSWQKARAELRERMSITKDASFLATELPNNIVSQLLINCGELKNLMDPETPNVHISEKGLT